jgi:hypothetical protein
LPGKVRIVGAEVQVCAPSCTNVSKARNITGYEGLQFPLQ